MRSFRKAFAAGKSFLAICRRERPPIDMASSLDKMTSTLYYLESLLVMTFRVTNRVKDLRLRRGWTQQDLPKRSGLSTAEHQLDRVQPVRSEPSTRACRSRGVFGAATDEIFTLEIHRGESESAGR
jgi:DNA-binding XRE family transcriptional regulator